MVVSEDRHWHSRSVVTAMPSQARSLGIGSIISGDDLVCQKMCLLLLDRHPVEAAAQPRISSLSGKQLVLGHCSPFSSALPKLVIYCVFRLRKSPSLVSVLHFRLILDE